ncbi:hypothetical protein HXX76_014143 [Chlamydomonas incerta]|uniref:Uncharacterized protein n=1 Tax=Chlamydomonas incerta TaxID=51695 RepID=A0A835SQZ2_CHLIN|nr:hypothetical protein HXX76_014143 [Chlamydomonas incerta]|eukprot:KAG2424985.1 hypothetical protein HXX76_014143 [Chlamydomonas incerta]
MWILAIILGLVIIIALFGGCIRCSQEAGKMGGSVENLMNGGEAAEHRAPLLGNSRVTVSDVVAQPAGGVPAGSAAAGSSMSGPGAMMNRGPIPSAVQASTSNVAAVDYAANQFSSLAAAASTF